MKTKLTKSDVRNVKTYHGTGLVPVSSTGTGQFSPEPEFRSVPSLFTRKEESKQNNNFAQISISAHKCSTVKLVEAPLITVKGTVNCS